jgi:hypothetical protein
VEKIRAKSPVAMRMIEALGMTAARGLVERIKTSDSVAERMDLAQLILKAGPDAGTMLAEEALQVKAPSEALKLLDLIPHAMIETQSEVALGKPAAAIRRSPSAARRLLPGRPRLPRAGALLVEALKKEADPSAARALRRNLGMLKYEAGARHARPDPGTGSETEDVRCIAAAALGNLSRAGAVIPSCRAPPRKERASAWSSTPPRPPSGRPPSAPSRTSRAYPEARDAIKRSLDDPDAAVRDAAREATDVRSSRRSAIRPEGLARRRHRADRVFSREA